MFRSRYVALVALALLAVAAALPLEEDPENTVTGKDETGLMDKLNSRCSKREASACLMLKLVAYVNRLLKKADIPVADGLEISRTSEETTDDGLSDARGAKTDEEAVGNLIAGKMWTFVKSRSLRWEIVPGSEVVLSTSPDSEGQLSIDLSLREAPKETGRGKKNNFGPLLAAGAMKIGMVGVLAFKALALLVGKALLVSKLAFLLAAVIGLKKLFSHQKHVTYEVVAHPHHSHSHTSEHGHGGDSYSSGWGRSIDVAPAKAAGSEADAQKLAYKAHAQ
ncbi:uncharacterized protein LOC106662105 [Cimex lectularius]|uniref:Osiris n=1 Tax=Cimex lectularius TaxID=79782 RepID=A0A8I6RFD9_CIMLE|nr:uncharacterized protein LOC106662105 [Cimex lectularius]